MTTTPPTPARTLAWINQSQGDVSDAQLAQIVEALNLQAPDVAAAWGPQAFTQHVAAAGPDQVPAGADRAVLAPDSDVAGALGYHDRDPQGNPDVFVFSRTILSNGGTVLTGFNSILACCSHEAAECSADPDCTLVATDGQGRQWADEDADPVESDAYPVTLKDGTEVSVSNFVYPAFFNLGGQGPFDHMGKVQAPFTMDPGGYAIINNEAVFGEAYPEWKRAMKLSEGTRTWRRTRG